MSMIIRPMGFSRTKSVKTRNLRKIYVDHFRSAPKANDGNFGTKFYKAKAILLNLTRVLKNTVYWC